jgi:hypothetical protein
VPKRCWVRTSENHPSTRLVHKLECGRSTKRQTRREAGAQNHGPLPGRGGRVTERGIMDGSGIAPPRTSGHPRRGHAPGPIAYGGRAPGGRFEREGIVARSYERFLELPVVGVLTAMWAAGVALLGSCALILYLFGSLLLQTLA